MPRAHPGQSDRLFAQGLSPTARLMIYGLLAVILMALDHRGRYVPQLRSAASQTLVPIYYVINAPLRGLRHVAENWRERRVLAATSQQQQEELLALRARLQNMQVLAGENRRLRALLSATDKQQFDYLFAEFLAVDLDPFSHRVLINRGRGAGVSVGQAAIDAAGVVGQIEMVLANTAYIRLISDPSHAVPVQLERNGLRSLLLGTGEANVLRLKDLPNNSDIQVGDILLTSGLGKRFPPGYPVARVISVTRDRSQAFTQVVAEPLATLDHGREVLLVRPGPVSEADAVLQQVEAEPDGPTESLADQP